MLRTLLLRYKWSEFSVGARTLLLVALMCFGSSSVLAEPLCTTIHTAQQLEDQGAFGCQFGDKIFYNFTYSYTVQDANGGTDFVSPLVPASDVTVNFYNVGGNPWAPVIQFLNTWDVINGDAGDIRISYSVFSSPDHAMYYSDMTAKGKVSNIDPENQFAAYISAAETVCCPAPGSSVVSLYVELDPPNVPSGLTPETASDQAYYGGNATQIDITKDIFISSGSPPAFDGQQTNEALLNEIDQGLYEVGAPEPLTFLLFGGGLVAIGLLRVRKRSA